jgi:hypothetical protein
MPVHVRIDVDKPAHHRERHSPRDDSNKELPGWSPELPAKHEPPAVNRNIGDVGRWIARAEKHSGPAYAPGTGRKS